MNDIFELPIPNKEFIVIDFPMIIKNEDKAFEKLGGLNNVKEILKNNETEKDKKRIKLNFRPNMLYSSPAISDMMDTKAVILKVRQLRNKLTGEIRIVPEVLGSVKHIYDFKNLSDYQYSPHDSLIKTETSNNVEVFYDKILPSKITFDLKDSIDSNNKIYVPPIAFTKSEKISELRLFRNPRDSAQPFINLDSNFKPDPHSKDYQLFKEAFDLQPMWTTNGLIDYLTERDLTNYTKLIQYRAILADNILTGIWRRSWVKKNYDFKNLPESRPYQIVEFRANPCHLKVIKDIIAKSENNNDKGSKIAESKYKISRNLLPTMANCFYQLQNIEIPEVAELLKSEPVPSVCHEEWGWFTSDVIGKCRNIMQDFVSNIVEELMNESGPTAMEVM